MEAEITVQRCPELFHESLGLSNHTKANARPIFRSKQPVSVAALPMVDKEPKQLEQRVVPKPVSNSKWSATIVIVVRKEIQECVIPILQHVRAKKCTFFVPSIKYLECISNENARCPDPESATTNVPSWVSSATTRNFCQCYIIFSRTEMESWAIIFAVKVFHKFLYSRNFKLLMDH
ncbi:hypothetical protein ACTXT7_009538 [Hymenolepis weldensis]